MADRLDPYEDTRPCDCCGAPGALSHGRQEICVACLAAECDPLEQECRHVELEECENNAPEAQPAKVERSEAHRAEEVRAALAQMREVQKAIGSLSETIATLSCEFYMMALEEPLDGFAEWLNVTEGRFREIGKLLTEERARLVRVKVEQ